MSTNDRSKNWIEYSAALRFLEGKGITDIAHSKDLNLEPNEPADIAYKDWKFQVTTAHGEDVGRIYRGESRGGQIPTQIHQIIEEYIENPVQRKIDAYHGGEAVKDMTLLIYDVTMAEPLLLPNLEEQIREYLRQNRKEFLKSAGFKDIYLVFEFQGKIMRVYPLD